MKKILLLLIYLKTFSVLAQKTFYEKAYDAYEAHNFSSATGFFTLAINNEGEKKCECYGLRGLSKLFLNNIKSALNDLDSSIIICPQSDMNYYNKGFFYAFQNKNDSAIIYYTKAINLDPTNAEYYMNRAIAYGSIFDSTLAIKDLNKAILLDSSNYLAYFNLGVIYKNTNQYSKALVNLKKAYVLSPDNIQVVIYTAYCQYALKNYMESFNLCNKHLKDVTLKADLIDFFIIRGQSLYYLKKRKDACIDFSDLYKLDKLKGNIYMKKYCK
jgi:tetratricopeptide (TPR) repeat protein